MRNWNVIDYTIEDYKDDTIPCDERILLRFEEKDPDGNNCVDYHIGRRISKWSRLFVIATYYRGARFSVYTVKDFMPIAWSYIEDNA